MYVSEAARERVKGVEYASACGYVVGVCCPGASVYGVIRLAFHTYYFMHRTGVVMAVGAIADPELTQLDPYAIGWGGCCCKG